MASLLENFDPLLLPIIKQQLQYYKVATSSIKIISINYNTIPNRLVYLPTYTINERTKRNGMTKGLRLALLRLPTMVDRCTILYFCALHPRARTDWNR